MCQYALLLALGEYSLNETPESRRETLLKQLADSYRNDSSSGVHGAAGWLLRQWGQAEVVQQVDQSPVPYSADREWFTPAITVTPTSPPKLEEKPAGKNAAAAPAANTDAASDAATSKDEQTEKPDESDNHRSPKEGAKPQGPPEPLPPKTFYYTFIVFPAGDSQIGSLDDETDRQNDEVRQSVTLTHPFALLDREITFEELIDFFPQYYTRLMQKFDAKPEDAGFGAHWYDSVSFCRWLSHQSGFMETDQSYADPESLEEKDYPREPNPEVNWAPRDDWPQEFGRCGYRLPTETEWEVAARAGARTAYGYGSDMALLDRFGWCAENSGKRVHPPRQQRPGSRGVFDMHGNLFEWTHDWFGDYREAALVDPVKQNMGSRRVIHGGGCHNESHFFRAAHRFSDDPTFRSFSYGFRLALSSPSIKSPEAEQGAEPVGAGTEGVVK